MRRLACALVALYPEPWRERYGEEMRALIEDDPPRLRGLGSIVLGAADAHLRPLAGWRTTTPATSRMRASISGIFFCWIALSVAGAGFQKETEDPPYAIAGHEHMVLSAARDLVLAGALLGAAVLARFGLPLLWRAVRQAYLERDTRLTLALGLAPAAIASFALLTGALVLLARGNPEHARTTTTLAIVLPWWAAGLLCATACAIAPRLALRRLAVPARSLRRASRAGALLALAMALVTVGLILYTVSLALLEPALSGNGGGPFWPSTGSALAAAGALAALSTALGTLGAARARRAAAEQTGETAPPGA